MIARMVARGVVPATAPPNIAIPMLAPTNAPTTGPAENPDRSAAQFAFLPLHIQRCLVSVEGQIWSDKDTAPPQRRFRGSLTQLRPRSAWGEPRRR